MSEDEIKFDLLNQRSNMRNDNTMLNDLINSYNQPIDSNPPTTAKEERNNNHFLGKKTKLGHKHKKKGKRKKVFKKRTLKNLPIIKSNNNLPQNNHHEQYKIGTQTNFSIIRGNNSAFSQNQNLPQNIHGISLPWQEIEEDDNDNEQRQSLILLLCDIKINIDLIDLKIKLLKIQRKAFENYARFGFIVLQQLPVEVSTEASSGDEKE